MRADGIGGVNLHLKLVARISGRGGLGAYGRTTHQPGCSICVHPSVDDACHWISRVAQEDFNSLPIGAYPVLIRHADIKKTLAE